MSSDEEVQQYLVHFEGNTIALSPDQTFENALDIVFKVTHNFDYEYNPMFKPFFSILENLAYSISEQIDDSALETYELVKIEIDIISQLEAVDRE